MNALRLSALTSADERIANTPPPPSPAGRNSLLDADRSLGPDAARALGALLVVFMHACVPYLVHPMPGLVWPVRDASSSICDAVFWSIEVFVMPLFLVLSGVYSYRALMASGTKTFLRSRSRRLLRPLLFGIIVVLPLDLYVWVLGLVAEGLVPAAKLRSLKLPSPYGDQLWGLSHLWYLLYVFLYGAVLVLAVPSMRGGLPMRWRATMRRFSAVAVALTGAVTLLIAPQVVYGFQHAFYPVFSKWIYSGTFFAGGVAIAVFDPQWRTIDRLSARNFLLGAVATAASVALGCWTLRVGDAGMHTADGSWLAALCLASMTVAAAWCMALGIIGLANRAGKRLAGHPQLRERIRYVAEASFWIYLMHHPLVGLIQIDLKWLLPTLSPFAKACLATSIALVWSLTSYEWLLRTSKLGRLIGITSAKREPASGLSADSAASRPAVRAAA